jgi:DNA-binding CsgD family transcriptional regulator
MGSDEDEPDLSQRLRTRGDLTAYLTAMTHAVGADCYLLMALPNARSSASLRILAANWMFDAVELAGRAMLGRLAASALAAAPGEKAFPVVAAHAADSGGVLSGEEMRLLQVLGHGEIWTLKVQAGAWRFFLLLSGALPGAMNAEAARRAQLECGYALSQVPGMLAAAAAGNPLSERERECLFWVSEGKTTDEVSVILGVAANTVNSYITHAMQKLSASNRPMAVATAIRNGII